MEKNMSPRLVNTDEIYIKIWKLLQEGAEKGKSDFHLAFLSTISDDIPRVRTVVLRRVIIKEKVLIFHTDRRSSKIKEIEKSPFVSLLFYSKEDKLQIRIEGRADIYSEGALFEKQWNESRPISKRCYLIDPGPGTVSDEPISGIPAELVDRAPTDEEAESGKSNFRVVSIKVFNIEWLNLHSDGHVRAKFEIFEDGYNAKWLIP